MEKENAMQVVQAQATTTEKQMIATIAQMAINPSVDVEKIDKLLSIQIKMMDRQAKMDYDQALANVQAHMPRINRRGEIKNKAGHVVAKYMLYEDIDEIIRPLLHSEGFSLKHDRQHVGEKMIVTTTLKHRSGYEESVSIPLPYDKPNALKSELQAAVGTFSVGKRVNVCSLLNIVAEGEDDESSKSEATPISEEQAAEIKEWLERLQASGKNVDIKKFVNYLGSESVDQIPLVKYETAIELLRRKERD